METSNKHLLFSKMCYILRKAMGKLYYKTSFPQTFLINGTLNTNKYQIAEGRF